MAAAVTIIVPQSAETRTVAATFTEARIQSTTMTSLPRHLLASIDRINAALEVALEQPPPATGTLRVCFVTEEEWNAFADCDGQVVHPNYREWFPDCGEIHVIEFENGSKATKSHRSATNTQGPQNAPDLSYGPYSDTPHTVLPPAISDFDDFCTIKIEIGVSQPWGMAQGQLDHKAIEVWAHMPGVEYVLCIKFDPDLRMPSTNSTMCEQILLCHSLHFRSSLKEPRSNLTDIES
ncbi:CCR4-NOT transcription complex subunit 2 [Aphanomyces cochlioides]|nr:CCR4-NOT transcription complex subunit 2 [Aphanomyces cochlioides]